MHEILKRTPHQQRVDEFMRHAKQELPDRPTLPDEKTRLLRAKLILEEVFETVSALGVQVSVPGEINLARVRRSGKEVYGLFNLEVVDEGDLAEIADGCADIIVVTTGTLSACGIADDSVQREVDFNNLAKFEHRCPKCGRTDQVTHNLNKGNGWVFCTACNTDWQSGHHNEAGKWVKPANHKGPRVTEVLIEQIAAAEACGAETVRTMPAAPVPSNTSECFGVDYLPSSSKCITCSQRVACIEKFLEA